jgi:hypothetical protein
MTGENGGAGNTAATCSNNLTFAPNSQLKSYSCELASGSLVADLIAPGSMLVQCHTGLQAGQELPAGDGAGGGAGGGNATAGAPAPAPSGEPTTDSGGGGGGGLSQAIDSIISAIGRRRQLLQQQEGAPAAATPATGSPYCEIGFKVKSPEVQVKCVATDCIFNPGQSQLQCAKTACTCPGSPDCGSRESAAIAAWLLLFLLA